MDPQEGNKEQDGMIRIPVGQIRKASGDDSRIHEFVISDESADFYGTVVKMAAWDLSKYNGSVGYQHNQTWSSDPKYVIGKSAVSIEDKKLVATLEVEPADINEMAETIHKKLNFGSIRSASVGFLPIRGHWGKAEHGEDEDLYYFEEVILYEWSVVNVGANFNALKRTAEEALKRFIGEKPNSKKVKSERSVNNTISQLKGRVAQLNIKL